jgi:hypothetical protein
MGISIFKFAFEISFGLTAKTIADIYKARWQVEVTEKHTADITIIITVASPYSSNHFKQSFVFSIFLSFK